MIEWLHSSRVLVFLFAMSLAGFVVSLIAIPWILLRLPPHYFDERHPRTWLEDHHPWIRFLALAFKNLTGIVFVLAGIAMLVLPGQGLLTMLIGLSFVDFPGKRALERKIVSVPMVIEPINALRKRFGYAPLVVYPHCHVVPETSLPTKAEKDNRKAPEV